MTINFSRRGRFLDSYSWLILKNVLGWLLMLAAFVAGPLVPGPAGIPLFLIGFALVSLPGKRRLTTRVLRGRPIHFQSRRCLLVLIPISALLALGSLLWLQNWHQWPSERRGAGLLVSAAFLLAATGACWLLLNAALRATNLLLRLVPRIRRHVRPWLRRHRIRLLPPRRRRRLAHESGSGPKTLKDEIVKFGH